MSMTKENHCIGKQVVIFTDGACSGNPGVGGWGLVLRCNDTEEHHWDGEADTTNNRMELMAVIRGLELLLQSCDITLVTDSKYVIDGITDWIFQWKKKGWKTAAGKPVKNKDLWVQLDDERKRHTIDWQWVKGHSNHPYNELADTLAKRGIEKILAAQK